MRKKRIIFGILILIWMVTVFCFSAQEGDSSSSTSGNTIRTILKILPGTKDLSSEETENIVEKFQPVIRKLAHYSIYTLGGILIFEFVNTFQIRINKKKLYSAGIGFLYAITDETHQHFVPGREGKYTDVCIDTCGIVTGIIIICLIIKLITKRKSCVKKA